MGKVFRRLLSCACAVVLAVACVPGTALARPGGLAGAAWETEIPALLAAGSYAEGEAIVGFWEGGAEGGLITQAVAPYEAEPLMEVAASNVPAWDGVTSQGAVLAVQSAEASRGVQIVRVTSGTLTTEELLCQLAADERVAFAEPNYVTELPEDSPAPSEGQGTGDVPDEDEAPAKDEVPAIDDASGEGDASGEDSADKPAVPPEFAIASDLTELQWAAWADGARVAGTGNHSINVPNFGANLEEDPQVGNMPTPVVVAVVDQPVDYRNPDLQPMLYHFTAEQQRELGCGEWGYDASAESSDGVLREITASSLWHGSHVAGIIGARWDGRGTSGVASNVRVISVANGTEDGKTSLGNTLRGYAFLERCLKAGIPVQVVNNSWALWQSSRAFCAVVDKLGGRLWRGKRDVGRQRRHGQRSP